MSIDLHAIIRSVLDETDLTSPEEITKEVISRIPQDQYHDALLVALENFVRTVMSRSRMRGAEPIIRSKPQSNGSSPKRAAIRTWAAWLRARYPVGDSHWKMLGDCTYDDLMLLVAERKRHAAENQVAADKYESLAKSLREYKVKRVASLPPKVLASFGQAWT